MMGFFSNQRYRYRDLLFEIKFNFDSRHLSDDSDELVGIVPKGIIVCMVLSHLGVRISLEGVVVNNFVSYISKCISKDFGFMFRHPRLLSLVIFRLIHGRG